METRSVDVIIIGGSYAGLSAAMALGRSLRSVLVIDSGNPCNKQTPQSHNFITQDGVAPAEIARKAKDQVLKYDTVKVLSGLATAARKTGKGFEVETEKGEVYECSRLLVSAGVTDLFPDIEGFAECWGISILHCPYCHGYEVKHRHIGLLGNGDTGFEFCRLISNWSKNLTLFTNGPSTLSEEQINKIKSYNIEIVEKEIASFEHSQGQIQNIVFVDQTKQKVDAVFAKAGLKQHSDIPEQLGCELVEHGLLQIDDTHQTTVQGVYAAGDNTTLLRSVAHAVSAGSRAGAFINKNLIDERF